VAAAPDQHDESLVAHDDYMAPDHRVSEHLITGEHDVLFSFPYSSLDSLWYSNKVYLI
jgi:hypothetical protein